MRRAAWLLVSLCGVSLCSVALCGVAQAGDWQMALDVRAVSSDGRTSFLENGQGKLRFDEDHQGIQLGRARFALSQPLGDVFFAHAEASIWDGDDKNPVDLTEAWLEYRPYPRAGFKARARIGAFYPPFSLESRALGWETPYAITPSAIGSWIGEEIRTVGIEGQVDWLGTRLGHSMDLQLTAAVFGWNDPAGTMLGAHGWALHDRQTTLFGRVGANQPNPARSKKELFVEIDDRPGYYLGAQARYHDRVLLDILHYDNRADPTARDADVRDLAWLTKFDAAALRLESADGWTALVQYLDGGTYIQPGPVLLDWLFDSWSALIAKRRGPHMLALRHDEFGITFRGNAALPNSEDGNAWTVAYSWDRGGPWRFALEWLRVRSDVPERVVSLGESPLATESKIEFSARYLLSGSF
jgi:hypothetical protein